MKSGLKHQKCVRCIGVSFSSVNHEIFKNVLFSAAVRSSQRVYHVFIHGTLEERPSLKALKKPEAPFSCDHVLYRHCVYYYFSRDNLISFRAWLSRAVHCKLKVTQGVLSFSTLNRISRFLKVHRKRSLFTGQREEQRGACGSA